jgi:hypothetical protein
MLATYHWKGFEKSYNFVVWKHFNQNSYVKIMITQNFEHICSQGTWLFLGQLKPLFPHTHGSLGKVPFSLGNSSPCSPCAWFPREGALFLGELRPFLMENSLFLKKKKFPLRTFLIPNELAWDYRLVFFSLGKFLVKGN